MITITIVCCVIGVIVGASKGLADGVNFHPDKYTIDEKYPLFFNPQKSWRNKWKNGNKQEGEAFWGSSTFLVFLTDWFHLSEFIKLNFLIILGVILSPHLWYIWIGIRLSMWLGFKLLYR